MVLIMQRRTFVGVKLIYVYLQRACSQTYALSVSKCSIMSCAERKCCIFSDFVFCGTAAAVVSLYDVALSTVESTHVSAASNTASVDGSLSVNFSACDHANDAKDDRRVRTEESAAVAAPAAAVAMPPSAAGAAGADAVVGSWLEAIEAAFFNV